MNDVCGVKSYGAELTLCVRPNLLWQSWSAWPGTMQVRYAQQGSCDSNQRSRKRSSDHVAAGTYDVKTNTGGPSGSVRFSELSHAANAGLSKAVELIQPIVDKYPRMTIADLYQFASVVAIEFCGGPRIPFRCGRIDVTPEGAVEEGRLPDAKLGSPHLRDVFYRMGFNDQEIVALSGAHTLGRAHKDRSGFEGAWTAEPLRFDNSYFVNLLSADKEGLLKLPTDRALVDDAAMRPWVEKYAADSAAFFADYARAHHKLSELGMASLFVRPARL